MLSALRDSVMITAFVATMMLLVEYINVMTGGAWQKQILRRGWRQYLLAAGLGAIPGCLGAFSVVAMYSHGLLSLGAVTAAMVAASGDEAFVMLALIPRQALLLIPLLAALGILTGLVVDSWPGRNPVSPAICPGLAVHTFDRPDHSSPRAPILSQWRHCSAPRAILALGLALFCGATITGAVGPREWNWVRASLLFVSCAGLFVTATVSDHFLQVHLWDHVIRRHLPRVFLWTLGALAATGPLLSRFHLDTTEYGQWVLLLAACVVGLVPESGPHLVFVTLFAQGSIPFGVLLASSIVQDGHGMLPMLAHSRRDFIRIKAINFAAGMLCGAAALAGSRLLA